MASYGVYVSVCGFEYHGPQGRIGFAPKISPENFRAAFIAAEGWGTFQQTIQANQQTAKFTLRWGQVRLNTVSLAITTEKPPRNVRVTHDKQPIDATLVIESNKAVIQLAGDTVVNAGDELVIELVLRAEWPQRGRT
jgi:hypothetical protein